MSSIPIGVLAVAMVAVFVLFGAGGVVLVRRRLHGKVREGHNDVLVPLFLTGGTLYAVLLAFLVIAVWEQYGAAKENASQEAAIVATMYRQTDAMPRELQAKMREHLRQYNEAVINVEWDAQSQGSVSDVGDVSDDTRKAIAGMLGEFKTLPPEVAGSPVLLDFARNITTLSADRSKRLIASGEGVPTLLWWGMGLGALVVISMSFMLYMERRWPHVVMTGVLAGLMGLMLFLAFVLDHPFSGQLKLKPDAFEHAASVFDSVDGGA
jgi:hypothetical protein